MSNNTKYNKKSISDRQIDTLIGLSKGMIADGVVNQQEAEVLQNWLIQSARISDNSVVLKLLEKVKTILDDGILDNEESIELLGALKAISAESTDTGELPKPSTLPLNKPMPQVIFPGNTFLFTGTCVFGTRAECNDQIEELGGIPISSVTQSLNYLILGTYVTDSWIHETYGRKIEKAMDYRDRRFPLCIISEEHWLNEAKL